MIVVDTSVWIDWIRRENNAQVEKLVSILGVEDIVVGDIVLLELLQGARDDLHARKIEKLLADCIQVTMLDIAMASFAASNFRALRSKGATLRKTPDLIIGTYCIEHGHALLHNDRDFQPMVEHLGLIEF